jgi:hypothetical protein
MDIKKIVKMGKKGMTDKKYLLGALILFEIMLLAVVSFQFVSYNVGAEVGENATVVTTLQVGNVYPEIINVTLEDYASNVDLTANDTTEIVAYIIARDFNGEDDIAVITGEFFDNVDSSLGDTSDDNYHYRNSTCEIDTSYGDPYEVNATCTFSVQYFANNQTWNASITVNDTLNFTGFGSDDIAVNTLLAVGLPDTIDYGEVNATAVSSQQEANITNFGNVIINLSLSGYAVDIGDGLAMNCTLGSVQNISIEHEKFNLTISNNTDPLTLAETETWYSNLSSSVLIHALGVPQRQDDSSPFNDDTNSSYWRIYVPIGVAGNCTGNIVFGAVQDPQA